MHLRGLYPSSQTSAEASKINGRYYWPQAARHERRAAAADHFRPPPRYLSFTALTLLISKVRSSALVLQPSFIAPILFKSSL